MTVSVVVPAFNEETNIRVLIERLRRVSRRYEIIVVDDGSSDRTADVAEAEGAAVIRFPVNRGKTAACRAGVQRAGGDIIVFIDSDLQLFPEDIPTLVTALGRCDLVIGERDMRGAPRARVIANRLARAMVNRMTGRRFDDVLCGLRAVRKDAFMKLVLNARGYEFETALLIEAVRGRLRIGTVPVRVVYRGGKGMSPWQSARLFLFMLKRLISTWRA